MADNVVIEAVGGLPTSVTIAWICGIIALLGIFYIAGKKIYKAVEGYRKARNKVENEHETFENMQDKDKELEDKLAHFESVLQDIVDANKFLIGRNLEKELDECLCIGYIPVNKHKYIEQMYEKYTSLGGNGYIKERYEKAMEQLQLK